MGELDRLGKPQEAMFEDAKMEDAQAEGTVVFLNVHSVLPPQKKTNMSPEKWLLEDNPFPFKFLRWCFF